MAKNTVKKELTPEQLVAQNNGAGIVVENNDVVVAEAVSTEEISPVVSEDANAIEVVAPIVLESETPLVATETEAVVEAVAERTYECLGLRNHSCRIGGEIISIEKDKYSTQTSGVATVLQRAGVVLVK